MFIDLRSDTVTIPSIEMRNAIWEAETGDDVYGDDPTVNKLEELAAEKTGMESALFVASGTMGNLVSILAHSQRGDEIITGDKSHIFRYEGGGASALGGIAYNIVRNNPDGTLDLNEVESAVRDSNDYHNPKTSMVSLENTQNMCGGRAITAAYTNELAMLAHTYGLKFHIDGARIFNASVFLDVSVDSLLKNTDSVTFCLSKGLACPVGSVVCGTTDFIQNAKRWRKVVGGGMRQAGFLAAAGIVALDSMIDRLTEDHSNAKKLAYGLSKMPHITIDPTAVETNLVFFEIDDPYIQPVTKALETNDIKGASKKKKWRFATHYGIVESDITVTLNVLESVLHG